MFKFGWWDRLHFCAKEIREIRSYGLGYLGYLQSIEFEPGSMLEVIYPQGLQEIGLSKMGQVSHTLIIPKTVQSIHNRGITHCDLFKNIVYCGTFDISLNSSDLEYRDREGANGGLTKVYVSSEYSKMYSTFLNYTYEVNDTFVAEQCSKLEIPPQIDITPSHNVETIEMKYSHLNLFIFIDLVADII